VLSASFALAGGTTKLDRLICDNPTQVVQRKNYRTDGVAGLTAPQQLDVAPNYDDDK